MKKKEFLKLKKGNYIKGINPNSSIRKILKAGGYFRYGGRQMAKGTGWIELEVLHGSWRCPPKHTTVYSIDNKDLFNIYEKKLSHSIKKKI